MYLGNVLFIGHAATLDTCVQQLIGNKARSQDEFKKLKRITYCNVAMVQQEVILMEVSLLLIVLILKNCKIKKEMEN